MQKTDPQDILLDVRGLPPPEPLERVLDALDTLQPGQRLRMLVDREPRPLYRILDANGHRFEAASLPDFSFEVLIWPAS